MARASLLPSPRDRRRTQRDRLLFGTAAATAQRGYAGLRVEDVLRASGAARRTFYAHFSDKHEAFLAAYDAGAEVLAEECVAAYAAGGRWDERLDRVMRVFLEALEGEPAFAHLAYLELTAAGPDGVRRLVETNDRFVTMLRAMHELACREEPDLAPVGDVELTGCAGGVHRIVVRTLVTDGAAALPDAHGAVCRFVRRTVAARD